MRRTRQTVFAVIRQGDGLLLVQPAQLGNRPNHWCLPGGEAQLGEPLALAIRRIVHEQSGLQIHDDGLLVQITRLVHHAGDLETKFYLFELPTWGGVIEERESENNNGHSAMFCTPADSVSLLQELQPRSLRDPLVSYLEGETGPGYVWLYHDQAGEELLVTRRRSSSV